MPKSQQMLLPSKFTIVVSPSRTVRVGTPVVITIAYESGDSRTFGPSLDLVRSPKKHPAEPIACGTLIKSQERRADFTFTPDEIGAYALRLRPFQTINSGQLINLFAISSLEEEHLSSILRQRSR